MVVSGNGGSGVLHGIHESQLCGMFAEQETAVRLSVAVITSCARKIAPTIA
jgi:hypothetical protein